jgi:hypothetical protein
MNIDTIKKYLESVDDDDTLLLLEGYCRDLFISRQGKKELEKEKNWEVSRKGSEKDFDPFEGDHSRKHKDND